MAIMVQGKYQLKSLHEEIDLFDRKLAHLLRYQEFASNADRDAAARHLTTKRELLVRAARQMANDGVEYSESELPRSFRTEQEAVATESEAAPATAEQAVDAPKRARAGRPPSPYAGTSLDFQKGLQEYKRKKKKA